MPQGSFWAVYSAAGLWLLLGVFITVPATRFVQYTFALSSAIDCGPFWFKASVVTAVPFNGVLNTAPLGVPPVIQYTLVASSAISPAKSPATPVPVAMVS